MPVVFSYGSLQEARVQLATFGRPLHGQADSLSDHARRVMQVADARGEIATVVLAEGDVLDIAVGRDDAELALADRYGFAAVLHDDPMMPLPLAPRT